MNYYNLLLALMPISILVFVVVCIYLVDVKKPKSLIKLIFGK